MIEFMNQLFHTSCIMAVIAAVYILAGALANGKYFAGDFYCAGKMILTGFIIPFRPRIKIFFPWVLQVFYVLKEQVPCRMFLQLLRKRPGETELFLFQRLLRPYHR